MPEITLDEIYERNGKKKIKVGADVTLRDKRAYVALVLMDEYGLLSALKRDFDFDLLEYLKMGVERYDWHSVLMDFPKDYNINIAVDRGNLPLGYDNAIKIIVQQMIIEELVPSESTEHQYIH